MIGSKRAVASATARLWPARRWRHGGGQSGIGGISGNWRAGGCIDIYMLLFSPLQIRQRRADGTLRDAPHLAEKAVIDVVIFAPLTGSGRAFEPSQHRADAIGEACCRQFVHCARSSAG